jgi:hypothetical protein
MTRVFFGFIAAVALAASAGTANAAIEAGAFLNITAFKIIDASNNTTATFGPGGDITAIAFILQDGHTSATLNGIEDSHDVLLTLDAPVAYVNSGGVAPGPENTFSPRPQGGEPYARADTNGGGSALSPVLGPATPGASVQTIADVVVPNTALISNQGNSSSTAAQTSFSITVPNTLTLRLEFDYLLDQTLDYSLPPSGLMLTS